MPIQVIKAEGCPACQEATDYFKNKGIVIESKDVDDLTREEVKELQAKYGKSVEIPVICNTTTGKCCLGFEEKAIEEVVKD